MPTDASNPYRSPDTGLVLPRPLLRWRIIPAFLACLYGVAALVTGIAELVLAVWVLFGDGPVVVANRGIVGWILLDSALSMTAGIPFCLAGRGWLNANYKKACWLTLTAIPPYLISSLLKAVVIFASR